MPTRAKTLIAVMLLSGAYSTWWASQTPTHSWLHFAVYLVAILLSSGLSVAMPKGDGAMSVNFPFILLGIIELSPIQAIVLAGLSGLAQSRIRATRAFTMAQVTFNATSAIAAAALASFAFQTLTHHQLEMAPALSVAVIAYFVANTIPVAMFAAWSKGEKPTSLWKRQLPWYLPFYLVSAVLAVVAHLVGIRFGWPTSLLMIPIVYTLYLIYRTQANAIQEKQSHIEETEALQLRTIEALAMAIEASDQSTHDHLLRVRVYVSEIGKSLGLTELEMKALLTASYLHDIGKLAVPEHIINKPGKLTKEEFEKMKIHPVVGADILERVRFPYPVVPIVRSHHEAWDGTGYPDGLRGEEIPIGARILTVVDCFDALASDRPYRRPMPPDEAVSIVRSKAGTQFDPTVVEVLERRYIELEQMARRVGAELAPLNKDVTVLRGAAPGAGFQQDGSGAGDPARRSIPEGDAASERRGPKANLGPLHALTAGGQESQTFIEMSQTPGNSVSPDEAMSVMSSHLRQTIPFDSCSVYLKTTEGLVTQYSDGSGAQYFSDKRIPLGEGLSGWVASSGRPIVNGNPRVEPHYLPNEAALHQFNSALALPLFDLDNEVLGVVTLYSSEPDAFSRDHLRTLVAFESEFSLAVRNALRFQAAQDNSALITQLSYVGRFFVRLEAEVQKARKLGEPLGVVLCDLNSLQQVIDRYSSIVGDALLRAVTDQCRACCRSSDTVARIGANEFVFLFPQVTSDEMDVCLDRIRSAVGDACVAAELDVEISISIGAALYPNDGETGEQLLSMAERRMCMDRRVFPSTQAPRVTSSVEAALKTVERR